MDETHIPLCSPESYANYVASEVKRKHKRCFVIMPFSGTADRDGKHNEDYWRDFFSNIIKPTVERLGYSCTRSDPLSTNIFDNILARLYQSDIVLAVLTDYNPNVWYELGARHTLHNGTIMLIEKGTKIPFDIQHHGVIEYKDVLGGTDFEGQLRKFVKALKKENNTDSPVRAFLNKQPVNLASVTSDAKHSPLNFTRALSLSTQTLLVVGQNLSSLTQFKTDTFRTLRKKEINVQLLLCAKKPDFVLKATRKFTHNEFTADWKVSLKHFTRWQEQAKKEKRAGKLKGKLQIRLSPHLGNLSLTFVDPDRATGMLEVTPVVYESQSLVRARFILTKREHRELFKSYWSAYGELFRHRGSRSILAESK